MSTEVVSVFLWLLASARLLISMPGSRDKRLPGCANTAWNGCFVFCKNHTVFGAAISFTDRNFSSGLRSNSLAYGSSIKSLDPSEYCPLQRFAHPRAK